MNAKSVITRDYEEIPQFWLEKNKANSLAFSVLRSAENPGATGEWDLKKQSQFSKGWNKRKVFSSKGLLGFFHLDTTKKTKPIKANFRRGFAKMGHNE